METESSPGTEVVEAPSIIDSADVPKPVEAENSPEGLSDLVERGKISLEQFSDAFAGILKAVEAQEAAKQSEPEPRLSGQIVPDMRPNIPIAPDQVTSEMLATQAAKEASAPIAAAMVEASASASAANTAEVSAPVDSAALITEVPTPTTEAPLL